jgi:hypothetical protein
MYRKTDERTDIKTKLIVTFRNFSNKPKIDSYSKNPGIFLPFLSKFSLALLGTTLKIKIPQFPKIKINHLKTSV